MAIIFKRTAASGAGRGEWRLDGLWIVIGCTECGRSSRLPVTKVGAGGYVGVVSCACGQAWMLTLDGWGAAELPPAEKPPVVIPDKAKPNVAPDAGQATACPRISAELMAAMRRLIEEQGTEMRRQAVAWRGVDTTKPDAPRTASLDAFPPSGAIIVQTPLHSGLRLFETEGTRRGPIPQFRRMAARPSDSHRMAWELVEKPDAAAAAVFMATADIPMSPWLFHLDLHIPGQRTRIVRRVRLSANMPVAEKIGRLSAELEEMLRSAGFTPDAWPRPPGQTLLEALMPPPPTEPMPRHPEAYFLHTLGRAMPGGRNTSFYAGEGDSNTAWWPAGHPDNPVTSQAGDSTRFADWTWRDDLAMLARGIGRPFARLLKRILKTRGKLPDQS